MARKAGRGSDEMGLLLGPVLQFDEYDQPLAVCRNVSLAQAHFSVFSPQSALQCGTLIVPILQMDGFLARGHPAGPFIVGN